MLCQYLIFNGCLWMWKTFILIQRLHFTSFCLIIILPSVVCNSGNTYMPIYLHCFCFPSFGVFPSSHHSGMKNYKTGENVWHEATTFVLKMPVQVSVNPTTGALLTIIRTFCFYSNLHKGHDKFQLIKSETVWVSAFYWVAQQQLASV